MMLRLPALSLLAVALTLAAASLTMAGEHKHLSEEVREEVRKMKARKASTPIHEHKRAQRPRVKTGIEVLKAKAFAPLRGMKIGLITNQTGIDQQRVSTIDQLHGAPGVKLVKLFSPEHGIRGELEGDIDHGKDSRTGLKILSLYGATRRPTDEMMSGLDAVVFDIHDIGARFYTYVTTMAYAMEACAKAGIPLFVLDRPNPIGGVRVEGPPLDRALLSFTGYFPMPSRHGMTAGELARLFNGENHIGCDLRVIKMEGWTREQHFDDTGVPWVNTSPNIRSPLEALTYVGVGALESTNLSVGRGTKTPFEVVGAPYVKGVDLAKALTARRLEGVRFRAVKFTPTTSVFEGKKCEGVFITVTERNRFDSVRCGLEIAAALYELYPKTFEVGRFAGMIGQKWVVERIREGVDPAEIQAEWQTELRKFLAKRARYLLYAASGERSGSTFAPLPDEAPVAGRDAAHGEAGE